MSLETFTQAYIACALWSSTDDDGDPLDSGTPDISLELQASFERDCAGFYHANLKHINAALETEVAQDGGCDDEAAGHDFWLTRNGHGAGFWDGDWPEPQATILDNASKAYGNVDLYVGDDGKVYGS